jgi:rubrerythrin
MVRIRFTFKTGCDKSTAEIKQALDVQREALRTVDEELASAEKQRAETMTTIVMQLQTRARRLLMFFRRKQQN